MTNRSCTRQALQWVALAGVSALAATAQAETPSASTGLMSFPHARVATAAPAAATPHANAEAANQSPRGFTAYKDPATGKLVNPTADQAAALRAAGASSRLRQGAAKTPAAPQTIYPASGGVGLVLDPSMDTFMLARKDANGQLTEACIPGEGPAMAALHAHRAQSSKTANKGNTQ